MIQIQKLAIANKSKGQISSKYLGNISAEIYQYGCQFVSNGMIYPNGSTRKRPGTRYVCPAFGGVDTRLYVVGNFVAMIDPVNVTFLHGRKPVLNERTTNPTLVKNGTAINPSNVFPSDVLYIKNNNTDATNFYSVFSDTAFQPNNSYSDFYHNRKDQDYDTTLRLALDKNKNFNIEPKTVYELIPQNLQPNYMDNPDGTPVGSTAFPATFPADVDLNNIDNFTEVKALFKLPVKIFKSLDQFIVKNIAYTEYTTVVGNLLLVPSMEETQGSPNDYISINLKGFKLPDSTPPKFFKADIVNDFRTEYLDQDIDNYTFRKYDPVNDKILPLPDLVPAIGVTNSTLQFSKVLGITVFQGRLLVATSGMVNSKPVLRLQFSAINDYTNFAVPSGTPTPQDPFYLDIDPVKFHDLNTIHEFANTLILGTDTAIYSLFSGSGLVEATKPIEIIKIADVGTAPAAPTLHNNNLYVVANSRQSLMKLTKEPLSVLIRAERILTLSDVHNTNGYIKKVINWMWDYQYIGVVTTDGMFLKMNIDSANENFNIWNADKGLILDAVKFTPKNDEDILYFVVHREGDTLIEIAFNNQEIPKYYHHYSVFRSRVEEDENKNRMHDLVLPNFVKNGFYADCAMTLKPRTDFKTVSIAGDTATFAGGSTGIKDDDMIVIDDKQFVVISFDVSTKKAEIENQGGYNFTDAAFTIKRKNFLASEYPMLHMFRNKNNIAVYGDGKSFYTSRYDNFNEDSPAFALNSNCDLLMNGYFSELTIGYVYRFLYVTTPITSPMSLEPSKPHTVNNLRVYMNFSYHIDFGMEPDKLDPLRLDKQNPIFGCQWFDLVNFNASGDSPNSLILKNDYPCPTEIVSINLSYSG